MDERQLAEMFRAAADGGPPASFEHADVVQSSRRATARRRRAIAGGTAITVAVLAGSMVVGGGFLRDTGGASREATAGGAGGTSSGPQVLGDQQSGVPGLAAPPSTSVDMNVPEANAEQGRTASGKVVPWPGLRDDVARAGCGPVVRELADVLVGELPATPTGEPLPVPDLCPSGAQAAAVPVDGGAVYVVLAPVTGTPTGNQPVKRDDGAVGYQATTPGGRLLLVLAVPDRDGGTAPYAEQVRPIAEKIATRY